MSYALTWYLWPPAGHTGGKRGSVADKKNPTDFLDLISGCGSAFNQLCKGARYFASVDLFLL